MCSWGSAIPSYASIPPNNLKFLGMDSFMMWSAKGCRQPITMVLCLPLLFRLILGAFWVITSLLQNIQPFLLQLFDQCSLLRQQLFHLLRGQTSSEWGKWYFKLNLSLLWILLLSLWLLLPVRPPPVCHCSPLVGKSFTSFSQMTPMLLPVNRLILPGGWLSDLVSMVVMYLQAL